MTNGIQEQAPEGVAWWQKQCTSNEWSEFFPLLVASDTSIRLFFAGSFPDRPDRSRAAGWLAAHAASAGRVPGSGTALEASTLLEKWMRRAKASEAKAQYPREDRQD